MAMMDAGNHGVLSQFPEAFFFQLIKQTFSGPILINQHVNNLYPHEYLSSVRIMKKAETPLTTREQLMLITAFFGFSKLKLSEVFNVSRQSIHNWYNNSEVANEHYDKIKRLADIVFEIDPKPTQQIFHVYINDIIEGYSKSLFDYILDDNFKKETVLNLSKTLYEMSKKRWKRIDSTPKAKYNLKDLPVT